jgi:sugar/nucleoside kinase (ribokinase family)
MLNDPTGAGDTFAGGFMGYLSQSSRPDFLEAVIMGSAMASFCVEGFGVESLLNATPKLLEHRVSTIKKTLMETV